MPSPAWHISHLEYLMTGHGTMLRIFIIVLAVTVLGLVTGIHAGETKSDEAPGRTMAKQATASSVQVRSGHRAQCKCKSVLMISQRGVRPTLEAFNY